jgi:hypothetical protein
VALLTPLTADERTTFLVVVLPVKTLRKLVGRLGTAEKGTRVDALSVWDLAWSLVDYYDSDVEVAALVDRTLRKDVGESALAGAVAAPGGAASVVDLVLRSKDPARDLAWALLAWGGDNAGPLASELIQTIIHEYDQADERAKEEAEEPRPEPAASSPEDELTKTLEKEAARARSAEERVRKRIGDMKDRLVELEKGIETARREARAADETRVRIAAERDRLAEEKDALRMRLQSGTAAEVGRLAAELETARRRVRGLESDVEEAREAEATLTARVRTLEEQRPARPATPAEDDERAIVPATWSLPIFTDEFYESIRRWDRKIVRIAFEKIARLAEDWRHPSLRAIPLEGLPGVYRIRIASDVRLMYRPLDGGRVEILSLIDREDLQRYIRQAKGN